MNDYLFTAEFSICRVASPSGLRARFSELKGGLRFLHLGFKHAVKKIPTVHAFTLAFGLSFVFMSDSSLRAASPTFIEAAANGKRLLHFFPNPLQGDPDLIVESGNKSVLFMGEKEITTYDGSKTVLVVDDSDVRHSAAGLVLATFDGEDIVHGRRGKVVAYYHHPEICPKNGASALYRVNGPELTKSQLTAVLYTLKPEIFVLTDEEKAAQRAEITKNQAEAEALARRDPIVGKWQVLNGHGPVDKIDAGDILFGPKKGEAYPVTFDYTGAGGPSWSGVAMFKMVDGDPIVFAAYGTPKTVGMCIYEINGGTLSGKWYPWYIDGDAKNVGTEELKGPESLDGEFTISSAKAPSTGAAYAGTVSIKPEEIVGSGDKQKPYLVTWTFGTTKVQGFGIRTGKYLIVSSGSGADVILAKFKLQNGTFSGDWFKLGSKEMGGTAAMN